MTVKLIFCGLYVLSLLACAPLSVDKALPLRIEGMQIENQTQVNVSAARLLVPVTGKYVSCGNIPPGAMCATTFPEIEYTGNPVEITWSQAGQIFSTGQFTVKLPDEWAEDKPAIVLVVIAGPGSAGAMIVQPFADTP
jgi:hypothetical protein